MEDQARLGLQAQLLEITHEAVMAFDVDERIIYWNRGAERTYGWSEREALGKAIEEVLRPIRQELGREERLEVLQRGETLSDLYRVHHKDGHELEVEFNARAFFDDRRGLQGYVEVHRDVTERRCSERAVREREARLQALFEASPLGIVIMDRIGNPIFYNPKCVELHGMGIGEAFGDGWEQAVHPGDRERIATSWYAAAREGRSWHETYRFQHRDGRVVWVSGRAAPICVDGKRVGFVGTLEDISAEREARDRAERATRMRDRMLAVVTHDLRDPLNTIGLVIQAVLADEEAKRRHARELDVIERAIATMNRLIHDLLDISRHEAGIARIRRERIDVGTLCREAVELCGPAARERGIGVDLRVDADLPVVEGDPHRIAQVLSNLLGNALKFTPRRGRVTVRADREDESVRISVEDTGPGIPPDMLPYLFELGGKGADGLGTGLGLSICHAIVTAHGGRIRAESRPGGGAAVRFTLP